MDGYAAGLIDGEGYIGIQSSGGSYQVRLKVAMSDKGLPALQLLHKTYGGRLENPTPGRTPQNRATRTWRITGRAAADVIRRLRPLLLIKAPPADIALEFQAMVDEAKRLPNGRTAWTEAMLERAEMLTSRIQEANRRGPDPQPPTLPTGTPIAVYRHGWWWEPEDDLFGPVEFTGSLPTSGRMVAGHIYELSAWAPATSGNDSSSSPLLGTPTSRDWKDGHQQDVPINGLLGRQVWDLA